MNDLKLYEFHQYLKPNIQTIMSLDSIRPIERVVEVGVFQGYFTFNMTNMMVNNGVVDYRHYAIDPFTGSEDLDKEVIEDAYNVFVSNLQKFEHRDRIHHYQLPSREALIQMAHKGIEADFIYIDGSHTADDVLQDLVLAWQILETDGVILCDDSNGSWMYKDKNGFKPAQKSPRMAVENFLQCFWDKVDIIDLPNNWQTAFVKRS